MTSTRIVISGAHGTGKTSLLAFLKTHTNFPILPEAGEYVLRKYYLGMLPTDMSADMFVDFQNTILETQINNELSLERYISDRCVLDNLGYAFGSRIYNDHLTRARKHLSMIFYTHCFYLPIEFPIQANDFRNADSTYQNLIDRRIREQYDLFGIPYTILSGNVQDRARTLFETLSALQISHF